jgi:16S rRNA (cytosine967-C5)-methyltransferase
MSKRSSHKHHSKPQRIVVTEQNRGAKMRADAASALFEILENGMSAKAILPQKTQDYDARDAAWVQEMVYGVLRRLPTLQFWLRGLLDKPLKGNKKVLEHLLMLGFYQLTFTRVSPHAAVSETVEGAMFLKGDTLKGLLNAILRTFIRDNISMQEPDSPAARSGLPNWIYKAVHEHYPDLAYEIIKQTNQKAPLWLRFNPHKVSYDRFVSALNNQGLPTRISPAHPHAVICDQRTNITELPGYAEGWFAVQDGAAQFAAPILDVSEGATVLDCCAAPGGKTAHLLALQPDISRCVAIDTDPTRLARVDENLARLGHTAELVCADAQDLDSWHDGTLFDYILLDAPCSATGIIRRQPDIRWLRQASDIAPLVDIQAELLRKMWQILKPGGKLLYATCSILPDENVFQIQHFLEEQHDANELPIGSEHMQYSSVICPIGLQILPGDGHMDGFYYALLEKEKMQ